MKSAKSRETWRASDALSRPRNEWETPRGVEAVLAKWKQERRWQNVVGQKHEDAALASFSPRPNNAVGDALKRRGIDSLYTHQFEALRLAEAGKNVVVATPTASGKSLCYHLPVLEKLRTTPTARALYLFPTKALARDQEEAFRGLLRDVGLPHGAVTYDGDTPGDARRAAREKSAVVITNPDMLHAGILPHHASWARFFAHLSFVVVDELHAYRGVFGSHLANVLRRLSRIADFHGAKFQYLFASATIGNPKEHAKNLSGRDVVLVDQSGAEKGARQVLLYNPPVVNQELGLRASYTKTAVRLAHDLISARVPTLVFGQSRNQVEVMLKYLRDRASQAKIPKEAIQGYRGGYLPDTRRRIEKALRAGEVLCVVATNALELGVDIGALDAVICAGYPGTVSGLWQRFGRAGRRKGKSLALLVTSSLPMDQYLAAFPEYVLGAPVEHARIDPDNVDILLQHLKCASFELPFREGDDFGGVHKDAVLDALHYLAERKVIQPVASDNGRTTYHWSSDAYPAHAVSLRSASWDNFVIVDVEKTQTIAEMDWKSTHTMLHEQAIYQHEGTQYQVERLDFENHKAYVRKVEPDYYTTAMTHTKVMVLYEDQKADFPHPSYFGEVNVVEKVVGYKKIKFHTHENVGYGEVQLPEVQLPTTAFWSVVPDAVIKEVACERAVIMDALQGLSAALHTVACLGLMIDARDLGRVVVFPSAPEDTFEPTIYLFDRVPGGVGLAQRLFSERLTVFRRARSLIERCPCQEGCPACVGPISEGASSPRKSVALWVLSKLGVEVLH